MIGQSGLGAFLIRGPDRPAAASEVRHHDLPGLVLVPLVAAVVALPLIHPAGPGNSSPVDVLIALNLGTFLLWAGWTGAKLRAPYAASWALLMIGGMVGGIAGGNPTPALLDLVQDLVLLSWSIAVVNLCRYPGTLRLVLRAWAVAAPIWGVVMIVAYFGHIDAVSGVIAANGSRAALTLSDPNMAASYFVMSLMVVAATRYPRQLWLRVASYAVLLISLALTGSNGGVLSLALATAVLAIVYVYRRYGTAAAVGAGAVSVLLAGLALRGIDYNAIGAWARVSDVALIRDWIGRGSSSIDQRTTLVDETIQLYHQGGPLGLGPSTTIANLTAAQANYIHEAHDDFIEALVERGLIGVAGIVMLVGSATARAREALRPRPSPELAEAVPNRFALVAALLGFAISATYYQVIHFRHGWLLLSIIAAIALWGLVPARAVAPWEARR